MIQVTKFKISKQKVFFKKCLIFLQFYIYKRPLFKKYLNIQFAIYYFLIDSNIINHF